MAAVATPMVTMVSEEPMTYAMLKLVFEQKPNTVIKMDRSCRTAAATATILLLCLPNQAADELCAVPAEYLPASHWTHVASIVAAAGAVEERKRENLLRQVEEAIESEQGAESLLNPFPLTPKPIKLSLS
jgi:hypothetical protein